MPKSKPSPRSKKKAKSPQKPAARLKKPTPAPKAPGSRQNYTDEYSEYLERYELYGEGRPQLSPSEFDRLDEEMLDLLEMETEQGVLSDDQMVRYQELEFLLLDSDQ